MANIRRTSAVDEVFQDIQNKIHSGEYSPGHVFPPQKSLAQEYGVGASTIREAMGKLTMLGYVSAKQGVGTTVMSSSSAGRISSLGQYVFLQSGEVLHFMEARLCLEKSAARAAAAQATEDDLAKMRECLELQAEAVRQGDAGLFSTYDKLFHLRIMEAGRNPILVQFMEIIQSPLFSFIEEATRLEKVMSNSVVYHEKIFDRIRARDGRKAEIILVEHLWDVARIVKSNLGLSQSLENLFRREGLKI